MRANEAWIVPGLPVLSLLEARPSALEVFEERGIDPWLYPKANLGTLASALRIPWAEFAGFMSLPERDKPMDLESASIPELLDFLIADHRDILGRLVPGIRSALAQAPRKAAADLDSAWKTFTAGLQAHIQEEETFLFPRLLHYDHCLRHQSHHPDFAGGSVNVYIAIRLLRNEQSQMAALRQFLAEQEPRAQGPGTGSPEQHRLACALDEFQQRLVRHNHVEEDWLYPKARHLEKFLYDAAIAGAPVRSMAI